MYYIVFIIIGIFSLCYASPFEDVPINHWAYNSIKTIINEGIIEKKSNQFNGNHAITRYEFALLVAKAYDRIKNDSMTISENSKYELKKMSLEFKDELSLLGIRINGLEDELKEIQNDINILKKDIKNIKSKKLTSNKNIYISGDSTIKYSSIKYDDNSNTKPYGKYYNSEYFEQRIALNLSLKISDGINGFVRFERYGDWNSSKGDWSVNNAGFGTLGLRNDTDIRTSLALIDVISIKNIDLIRIGRQPFKIGNLLNISGTYDGIVLKKTLFDDPFYLLTIGGFRFNNTSPLSGWNDTNYNDGLDLKLIDIKGNYEDTFIYELYYAVLPNPPGVLMPNGTPNIGNINEDSIGNYRWYGISLNYNIIEETLNIFGEYSIKKWDNNVDFNGDGNLEDNDDNAFITGLNYTPTWKNQLNIKYIKYGDYFTSIGVTGGSIIRRAEEMGYWHNFSSLLFNLNHAFDSKSSITLRYEDINDKSDLAPTNEPDNRNIYTAILKYKYKPNTKFTLTYRYIDTNDNTNKIVTPVAYGLNSGYISSAITGIATDTVGDLYELNLQLDVNF